LNSAEPDEFEINDYTARFAPYKELAALPKIEKAEGATPKAITVLHSKSNNIIRYVPSDEETKREEI